MPLAEPCRGCRVLLYAEVPFRQDTSYLSIGERTNANGSKAFRDALLAERWDDCVEIARGPRSATAPTCSISMSTTSAETASPTCANAAFRLATASTLPIVLDSTEPAVLQAGLECLGGRAVINSANYEDGDGPESRFSRVMSLVVGARRRGDRADHRRGRPGAYGGVEGTRRRAGDHRHHPELGTAPERHHHRLPDLPDCHRTGGNPAGRHRDASRPFAKSSGSSRRPDHARPVQRLLRSQPGGPRGAQLGVPQRMHRGRPRLRDRACGQDHSRLPGSPTSNAKWRSTWSTTGAARPPTPSLRTTRCNASWSSSRA